MRGSAYENDFKVIKPNEAIKNRMYQGKPSIGKDELLIDFPTDTLISVYIENIDQNPRKALRLKLVRNFDDENESVVARSPSLFAYNKPQTFYRV